MGLEKELVLLLGQEQELDEVAVQRELGEEVVQLSCRHLDAS